MPGFAPHGAHQISVDGRIVVVHTRGPWNQEEVQSYAADQERTVNTLAPDPWVMLAYIHGESVHTPEAQRHIVATIHRHHELGRRGTAVILDPEYRGSFIETHIDSVYRAAGEAHAFFGDEEAAHAWLQRTLAEASRT